MSPKRPHSSNPNRIVRKQSRDETSNEQQKVLYERFYYPFRHFPEIRQSVRAASERERKDTQKDLLPQLPVMEYKVHSFARAQSPTLNEKKRPKSAAPAKQDHRQPRYKHNEEKIFDIHRKMAQLRRKGSCLDEIYGLQHVRRVIMQETNTLLKEIIDCNDPRTQKSKR